MEICSLRELEVGDTLESTRDPEVRHSQDSLGVTLAKMPNIEERQLKESTSSRQTWPQVEGQVY